LPRAKRVSLKFKIRSNGIRVITSGEEIYRWIGNTDRLGERFNDKFPPEFKNYLGVFTQGSPILVEKLTVTPVTTSIEKTSTDVRTKWGIAPLSQNLEANPDVQDRAVQTLDPVEVKLTTGDPSAR
jgi:hypothetical protein